MEVQLAIESDDVCNVRNPETPLVFVMVIVLSAWLPIVNDVDCEFSMLIKDCDPWPSTSILSWGSPESFINPFNTACTTKSASDIHCHESLGHTGPNVMTCDIDLSDVPWTEAEIPIAMTIMTTAAAIGKRLEPKFELKLSCCQ